MIKMIITLIPLVGYVVAFMWKYFPKTITLPKSVIFWERFRFIFQQQIDPLSLKKTKITNFFFEKFYLFRDKQQGKTANESND